MEYNKKNLVNNIFLDIASKYDLMNDVMSLGIHRFWKDKFCSQIPNLNSNILDVAGGSGDISFRIMKRALLQNKKPNIITSDINQNMLQIARDRAIDNNILEGINFICCDAENLPFADNSFDYYLIAFGIRNVSNIEKALKEASRVLKTGGKFLCLEFSKVQNTYLAKLYEAYSTIIPKIGALITSNEGAYQYLVDSIKLFPDQEEFRIMLNQVGFHKVTYENLNNGIVSIHSGYSR